ncbi:MAG: DUF1573 domain-containing protein [Verrucomicrobia bacterium]|nr:DUF1573 domain-containing protein [Verrucomicrobiota bacterium]
MRAISLVLALLAGLLQAGDLKFEKELVELNLKPEATTADGDFEFTNASDHPVTISRVEKTCSCLNAQVKGGKLIYQPGEKGVVRAAFEVGNIVGTVDKTIAIVLEKQENNPIVLTVRAHVPVLVELGQKTLKWTLNGNPDPQKVTIHMKYPKPIRILKAECNSEMFKTELKTIKEGADYELWITPADMKRTTIGLVRLETDCEIERHKIQQVFAVVRADRPGEGAAVR